MPDKLPQLKSLLAEIEDLENAAALLEWDQFTYMPPGGTLARAGQIATLQKLAHQKWTHDDLGLLIDRLSQEFAGAPASDDEAALVRVVALFYRRKTRVPAALVETLYQATGLAQPVWVKARAEDNFSAFRPHLERIVDLKRQVAACFPDAQSPYDAMLDEYEPGMRTLEVRAIFSELRQALVPLLQAIAARPPIDDAMLRLAYDEQKQWDASLYASQHFGYDLERGRMDRSAHPFCTSFSTGDVRITSRVTRNYLPSCLMGTLHETGHALYEQGYPERFQRTPLGHSASLGIHESQSRLWENLVGRSRGFWRWFYPHLQSTFPDNLSAVDGEAFYRALNVVRPSFIRIDADEVTYNLHIMLRFEVEVEMLAGRLQAKDAPEAWSAQFKDLFGLAVPSDRLGVLQDTHWAIGLFGYFPTYTLGNLGSAQLFDKAVADLPGIPAGFERGDFSALLGWLRQNVHAHGRKYLPAELMRVATGQPLSAGPYLRYLWQKYQGIYGDLPRPPTA